MVDSSIFYRNNIENFIYNFKQNEKKISLAQDNLNKVDNLNDVQRKINTTYLDGQTNISIERLLNQIIQQSELSAQSYASYQGHLKKHSDSIYEANLDQNVVKSLFDSMQTCIKSIIAERNGQYQTQDFLRLLSKISSYSTQLKKSLDQIYTKLHLELETNIENTNFWLKQIFQLNRNNNMNIGDVNDNLDKIDVNLKMLSDNVDVTRIYSGEKNVYVSSFLLEQDLVSKDYYTQFQYFPNSKHSDESILHLTRYNEYGTLLPSMTYNISLKDLIKSNNDSGFFKAFAFFMDTDTNNKKFLSFVKNLSQSADDIMDMVNYHFSDAYHIPQSKIRGNVEFSYNDRVDVAEPFKFFVVNQNSDESYSTIVQSNALDAKTIKILNGLEQAPNETFATMQEITDAINYELQFKPSNSRVKVGKFQLQGRTILSTEAESTNHHFLNDLFLIKNQSDSSTVTLELSGNRYFDTDVEIASVSCRDSENNLLNIQIPETNVHIDKTDPRTFLKLKLVDENGNSYTTDNVEAFEVKIRIKDISPSQEILYEPVINFGSTTNEKYLSPISISNINSDDGYIIEGSVDTQKAVLETSNGQEIPREGKGFLSVTTQNENQKIVLQGKAFATLNSVNQIITVNKKGDRIVNPIYEYNETLPLNRMQLVTSNNVQIVVNNKEYDIGVIKESKCILNTQQVFFDISSQSVLESISEKIDNASYQSDSYIKSINEEYKYANDILTKIVEARHSNKEEKMVLLTEFQVLSKDRSMQIAMINSWFKIFEELISIFR